MINVEVIYRTERLSPIFCSVCLVAILKFSYNGISMGLINPHRLQLPAGMEWQGTVFSGTELLQH